MFLFVVAALFALSGATQLVVDDKLNQLIQADLLKDTIITEKINRDVIDLNLIKKQLFNDVVMQRLWQHPIEGFQPLYQENIYQTPNIYNWLHKYQPMENVVLNNILREHQGLYGGLWRYGGLNKFYPEGQFNQFQGKIQRGYGLGELLGQEEILMNTMSRPFYQRYNLIDTITPHPVTVY